MASTLIQIRGVDERTRDELKHRAARRGQSLTAYVRDLLEREASRPDIADASLGWSDGPNPRTSPASTSSVPIVSAPSLAVVDCSVIVDALTVASASAVRARLVTRALVAPALLDYEVVSVVRGLNLGGHLSDARAVEALSDYADLAIDKGGLDPAHMRGCGRFVPG